jgi:hypothetical protein
MMLSIYIDFVDSVFMAYTWDTSKKNHQWSKSDFNMEPGNRKC